MLQLRQRCSFDRFSERAAGNEHMDDLDLGSPELLRSLDELALINACLGGNSTLIGGVSSAIERLKEARNKHWKLVDAGCGSGDGLRCIARWARRRDLRIDLVGIDANPNVVARAIELSHDFPEIRYIHADAFGSDFPNDVDIVVCCLFLHHFPEAEILGWLEARLSLGIPAIVISDLQRHWLPYWLFLVACRATGLSKFTEHDGRLSVRRGFRRGELLQMAQELSVKHFALSWRWAFRYRLVLFS